MSLEDSINYDGGGFRRNHRLGYYKPKPNNKLMKLFGGFFNEMPEQEPPPPPPSTSPDMDGGRRYRSSPAKKRSPAKNPVRRRRIGGEYVPGVQTAADMFGTYFADPSIGEIANNTGNVFANLVKGGRKRSPVARRAASPTRRPVARRAASPTRRPVARRAASPKRRPVARRAASPKRYLVRAV